MSSKPKQFRQLIFDRNQFIFLSPEWEVLNRQAMSILLSLDSAFEVFEFETELKELLAAQSTT